MTHPSTLAAAAPYPLTDLDLAAGFLTGLDPHQPAARAATDSDGSDDSGLAGALRRVIGAAIDGDQAYVSFSGGRDSSAVLAIATDLCRRAGWPDPVPLTIRVAGSAAADESEWQETVVNHLRLNDWVRVRVTDELDVLGPVATGVLQRHGLLYPANGYFHDLLARHAAGGVLLGGGGGDELLDGSYAHHHARVRLGRERRTARTALAITASLAAKPLYTRFQARSVPRLRWLRPRVQARFARRLVGWQPAPVRGWAARVAPLPRARAMVGLRHGQDLIAAAHDTRIVNPFLDPAVVGAAMSQGGPIGLGGRAQAMRTITAGLLPDAVAVRQTKASFQDAVWTGLSRDQLRSDRLLDVLTADRRIARLLDLDGLRAEWRTPAPHGLTALLAQSAHLASIEGQVGPQAGR